LRAWDFTFMRQALIACGLVAAVAPLVGAFVVQRKQSLIGDGLGHVAFAGVGLAVLVDVNPIVGALALTVIAAVALHRLTRGGVPGDLSLALIFYGGIAVGFLFAHRAGAGAANVLGFLFGSPLNLRWGEVAAIAVLAVAVSAGVILLYSPLVAIAFDEEAARVAGVPTSGLALALTLVVALVTVGGMSTIGLLQISAMMIIPVAAGAQIANSYRATLFASSAIGLCSAVVGLLIAFYADLAPGAAIVLTAIVLYTIAALGRNAISRCSVRSG
jgi:zinc transport system permease protein